MLDNEADGNKTVSVIFLSLSFFFFFFKVIQIQLSPLPLLPPLVTVSLFIISMSLVIFCLLVCFVD